MDVTGCEEAASLFLARHAIFQPLAKENLQEFFFLVFFFAALHLNFSFGVVLQLFMCLFGISIPKKTRAYRAEAKL